jgi:hypothetical protein
MKLIFNIFFIFSISASAQTMSDVARSNDLTWYGIDFSHAQFINFGNELNGNDLKNSLVPYWSRFEKADYLKSKYDLDALKEDYTIISRRNSAIDFNGRLSARETDLDADAVKETIGEYEIKGNGYGIVFIIEGFQSTTGRSNIWVVFFNQGDKKIIFARRYEWLEKSKDINEMVETAIEKIVRFNSKDFRGYKKY